MVDNGSVDRSAELAKEAGARVIHHSQKGYGSALKRGIRDAHGRYIIMGDGDDTYDFSDLRSLIDPLRNGADLVMGSRLRGQIEPGAMPWLHRWIGTPALTFLLNLFFKMKVSDVNCGFRGFKKETIEKLDLKCDGMEFASEMLIKAAQKKLAIKETPVNLYAPPPGRRSHLHSFKDGWRHLRFMLIFCPKYLFLLPGLSLFALGLFFTALLHFKTIYLFGMPMGISSAVFASALLFVGMQVTLFGVFSIVLNSSKGLIEGGRIESFFKKYFTLERGLFFGTALLVLGMCLFLGTMIRIFYVANNLPYVDVSLTRFAIFSISIVLLGVQLIFSSFYVSLFNLAETLK